MPALLALRLVTYLMVCTGVAALYLANLIGAPGAALVVLAILVSWGHEQARERGAVRPALGWGLVATAAVAIAVDLFYLAYSLLDGMVHLLLFLILLRLFARRGLRDLRDAGLLSFFMLVAAASISFNLSFLFVFIAFFLLGTWMLILNHVVTELELAGRPGDVTTTARRVFFRGPLTQVSLVAAVITFSLAAGLFFVIPRVGQAALPLRASIGRMVTGFSDRVDLGSFGDIESDRSVVMRVYLADEWLDPATLPGLRWRGVAFDQFDGRTWSSAAAPRRFMHRSVTGDFGLGLPRGTGPVVRQEIYLEPIGSDAVFAAPRAVRLEMRSPTLVVDDMDGLTVSSPGARLHYVVESEIESPGRRLDAGRRASPALTAADRARFLQLPPLAPEIARLAREVTAGSADAEAAAGRISAHLSTNYRYTLALKRQTALAPLEEFLFVRRSGNCEYFAAAMAVMLRSIGVPARVAAGFQQGEWNPYGRYFMVRLSDAHAWVEVYLDGRGWVAFDPSPRAEAMAEEIPGRDVALPRRRPHALVSLRGQLEPARPGAARRLRPPPGRRRARGAGVAPRLAREPRGRDRRGPRGGDGAAVGAPAPRARPAAERRRRPGCPRSTSARSGSWPAAGWRPAPRRPRGSSPRGWGSARPTARPPSAGSRATTSARASATPRSARRSGRTCCARSPRSARARRSAASAEGAAC